MTPIRRFESMVAKTGGTLAALTPRAGLDLLLRFAIEEAGGARIRLEWGNVARHDDEIPGFTFHCEVGGGYPEWFSLLFRFDRRVKVERGGQPEPAWCIGASEAAAFRAAADAWGPYRALADAKPAGATLERPSEASNRPCDCWGARDPDWPVVSMTPEEWDRGDDVAAMSRWFVEFGPGEHDERVRLIHRYLLACCRRLWPILPAGGDLRRSVETAERWLDGEATLEEVGEASWSAEAEYIFIVTEPDDPEVARWARAVARRAAEEIDEVLDPVPPGLVPLPYRRLLSAAYLVHVVGFPGNESRAWTSGRSRRLPASLLRAVVGDPFGRRR